MNEIDEDDELDFEDEDEDHYKKIMISKHGNKKKKWKIHEIKSII